MISGLALAALISVTAAPQTRDWPDAGGFEIHQLDDSCGLSADYPLPGRSPVSLTLISDSSSVNLIMTSRDWSAKKDEKYELRFDLGDVFYEGEATGLVLDYIDKGFVAFLEPTFLDAFARAPSIYVTREDAVVAHLDLEGTAAAVAMLRRCSAHVARINAAQAEQERRIDYIAPDPFAAPAQSEQSEQQPRLDVITNVSWSRRPVVDFPARALERDIKAGSASVQCTTAANGSLSACSIISETPAGAGFGQAALRAAARAVVSPHSLDAAAPGASVRFSVPFTAP